MDKLKSIQDLCTNDCIMLTIHAAHRFEERGVKFSDVKLGIMKGEVIEDYPTDYPNPSVLIFGYTENNTPIHVVVGLGVNNIQIITAYFPSLDKWEGDFKTRKAAIK